MDSTKLMRDRASTRAFLDKPVARDTISAVLEIARWAPSGANMQPWDIAVVQGATKARITDALLAARAAGVPENPDYRYYPQDWCEPYQARRKACGLALYKALGIGRDNPHGRMESWNNNYRFFGAPVGLFFFLDRRLGQGAWLDLGMLMQNVMLAARTQGLATCPQAALAEYPDVVRRELGRDDDAILVSGMALGYPDLDAPVNRFRTHREPVENFTRWYE